MLQGSENSMIGILQGEYDPDYLPYYDGQFYSFPDIPIILETLAGLNYKRLLWQNVEGNVGEIFYKKVFPYKTYHPSGKSSGPPLRNIEITLESFLSDLPDNFTGYPVFQMYEFKGDNYILFRTKSKTLEQIRQLDQNQTERGTPLPSNFIHEGSIDISFDGGKLGRGFGEDRSFAEFLGNGGIYYLNAKPGSRYQNTLSVVSIHFFDPSVRPGGKPYRYEYTSGPLHNRKTSSIAHSGPVSHQSICDIKINLKPALK